MRVGRDGVELRTEREWQAEQWAMHIEIGQRIATCDDLHATGERAHQ